MGFKIRKLPGKKQEELQDEGEKLSVNRMQEGEEEGPVSVNRALDEERTERAMNGMKNTTKNGPLGNNLINALEEEESLRRNGGKTGANLELEALDKEPEENLSLIEEEGEDKEEPLSQGEIPMLIEEEEAPQTEEEIAPFDKTLATEEETATPEEEEKLPEDASKEEPLSEEVQEELVVEDGQAATDEVQEEANAVEEEEMPLEETSKLGEEENALSDEEEELTSLDKTLMGEEALETAEEEEVHKSFILEQEEEEEDFYAKRAKTRKGKIAPIPKDMRDTERDKTPLEEEDLGLPEDSFLMERKATHKDLKLQMAAQERQFLGGNVRKPRDFARIFEEGTSTKDNPKIDLAYELIQNPIYKRELIAQQLLHNYFSKDPEERRNTEFILRDLKLTEDEDFMEKLKGEEPVFENEDMIQKIVDVMPD